MAGRRQHTTGIEWTHFPDGYLGVEQWRGMTWNPTVGCIRVSPGCDHCYAFALHDQRYADNLRVAREGEADEAARLASEEGLTIPQIGRKAGVPLPWPRQYDQPFSRVQLLPERIDQPGHWRKPRAVFVDSMADLFHEDVPDDYLDRVFAAMALAPDHIFMVLTKRPERAFQYVTSRGPHAAPHGIGHAMYQMRPDLWGGRDSIPFTWPLPNVWQGTSVENQPMAALRVPWLLRTPAALHFLSIEPLLDAVNLRNIDAEQHEGFYFLDALTGRQDDMGRPWHDAPSRIDWVLVGGESGRGWRPMSNDWVEDIQQQCHAAEVAFFGKQRADFRSGQPLPGLLNEHQWPAAPYGGTNHPMWRAG